MKTPGVWKPLTRGTIGLILLLPASYFALTLTIRVLFGMTRLYYDIAPSFLESNPDIFSFDLSAWILYGPAFAVLINLPGNSFSKTRNLFFIRVRELRSNHWFNTAIFLQALLLFILVSAWLFIEHCRYR